MKDFDYFADHDGLSASQAGLPRGFEEQRLARRRARRWQTRLLILAALALCAASWFLWGYRDWMAYAFSASRSPLLLGDVTGMEPVNLVHNTYVSVSGITEHRGIEQKLVRGLSLHRQEFWYFRLLGSRGVFIEVEPDKERYGFATEVRVTGRVVDPAEDSVYASLIASYNQRFHPEQRSEQRIVQVGVVPGTNRWPCLLALALLFGLFVLNVWAVVRVVGHRRTAARPSVL
jgi:hypothetical protein